MRRWFFEFWVASIAIILLLPLFVVLSIAICLNSKGPPLFIQRRVGRSGRHFSIYKFRTMHVGSSDGRLVAVEGDRRVTGIGGLLRLYRLDELPQLFNIALGEMSFVGPRPELPHFVAAYSDCEREEILSVRPGLADLSFLIFHNEGEYLRGCDDPDLSYRTEILPEKIRLARIYVGSRTLCLDLLLIASAIEIIFLKPLRVWTVAWRRPLRSPAKALARS